MKCTSDSHFGGLSIYTYIYIYVNFSNFIKCPNPAMSSDSRVQCTHSREQEYDLKKRVNFKKIII